MALIHFLCFKKRILYDIFYNDGLFDASKGLATIQHGGAEGVILSANGASVVTAFADQPVAADGSIRSLTMCVTGFSTSNAGRLTGPDGNEMDTESFLASLHITTDTAIVDCDGKTIIASWWSSTI